LFSAVESESETICFVEERNSDEKFLVDRSVLQKRLEIIEPSGFCQDWSSRGPCDAGRGRSDRSVSYTITVHTKDNMIIVYVVVGWLV
jgi:hypothetical protein